MISYITLFFFVGNESIKHEHLAIAIIIIFIKKNKPTYLQQLLELSIWIWNYSYWSSLNLYYFFFTNKSLKFWTFFQNYTCQITESIFFCFLKINVKIHLKKKKSSRQIYFTLHILYFFKIKSQIFHLNVTHVY